MTALILQLIPRLLTALIGFSSQEEAMSFATANQNVAEYTGNALSLMAIHLLVYQLNLNINKFAQ